MGSFSTANKPALWPKLLKVQKSLKPLLKTKQAYGYKHVELAQVIEEVQGALNAEGIFVTQPPMVASKPNAACVHTMLVDVDTGEYMESVVEVPFAGAKGTNDAQAYGGAITYGRRYALMSMMGVAMEDDDGVSTSEPNSPGKAVRGPASKGPVVESAKITHLKEVHHTKAAAKVLQVLKDSGAGQAGNGLGLVAWLGEHPEELKHLQWVKKNFPEELAPITKLGVEIQ